MKCFCDQSSVNKIEIENEPIENNQALVDETNQAENG